VLLHRIVASWLLLVGLSAEVSAQVLAPEVVQQIRAASKIRVRLVGDGWRTLHAPIVDSVSLSYSGSQPEPPLPITQVGRIQVPNGSHAGAGAAIGGAVGLGLSLLAVAVTAGDGWVSPTTGQAVGAVVVWTALGAGLGAMIGKTSPRWTTVYVR
jgi:hypothetical protein